MFYLFFQTLKTVKTLKIELINLFTTFYYIIFLKANNDIFFKTRKIKAININNIEIKTRFKIKV